MAHSARPRVAVALIMHTEECDSRCRSCSYRLPAPGELWARGFLPNLEDLASFATRQNALTGGEPLVVAELPLLLRKARELGLGVTLLCNGLNLAARAGGQSGARVRHGRARKTDRRAATRESAEAHSRRLHSRSAEPLHAAQPVPPVEPVNVGISAGAGAPPQARRRCAQAAAKAGQGIVRELARCPERARTREDTARSGA